MIQKFAPDDTQRDDTELHRQIRTTTDTTTDAEDDEEFKSRKLIT
jgi:hypothetical protein